MQPSASQVSFHILNTCLAVCAAAGPAATTCHDVWCDNGRCTPGVVSHDVACTGKLCCCVFAAAGPSATIVTAVFWGVLYHPREPTALPYEDVSPRPLASALTHRQTTSSVRRTAHDTSLLKQEPRFSLPPPFMLSRVAQSVWPAPQAQNGRDLAEYNAARDVEQRGAYNMPRARL